MKKILIYILSLSMGPVSPAWAQTTTSPYKVDQLRQTVQLMKLNRKGTTIEDVFNAVKPSLTADEATNWKLAFGPYMKMKVPNTKVSWLDGKNGNALNPKVYVNDKGESFVIELSDNPDVMYRFNGKDVTLADMQSDGGRSKIVASMPPHKMLATHVGLKYRGKLLPAEWLALSKPAVVEKYLTQLRKLNLAVEKVSNLPAEKKSAGLQKSIHEFALACLFPQAFANQRGLQDVGKSCAFGGWAGVYTKKPNGDVSCDPRSTSEYKSSSDCASTQFACNPAVFGTSSNGAARYNSSGKSFCVSANPDGKYNDATMQCHKASPIGELKNHMIQQNKGNSVGANKAIEDYNNLLLSRMRLCQEEPASHYPDQAQACAALNERFMEFEKIKEEILNACAPGSAVPEGDLLPPPAPQQTGNSWAKWLPIGIFGLFVVAAMRRGKDKKKDEPVEPTPETPTTPKPPVTPKPPKEPPVQPPLPPVNPPTIPKVDRVEVPTTPTGTRPLPYNPNINRESVQ